MKLVTFLLYKNIFIYQVLCTLIYRRRSLYSFFSDQTIEEETYVDVYIIWEGVLCWVKVQQMFRCHIIVQKNIIF